MARQRGVFGYNLPSKVGSNVTPADFGIAGIIGRSGRGIDKILEITDPSNAVELVGNYRDGFAMRHAIKSLYTNARDVGVRIFIRGFVASDAVQATSAINDPSAANTLDIEAAWRNSVDKSADGNSTGYTLTRGFRTETTATANTSLATSAVLTCASVVQLAVGDVLTIDSTHFAKIVSIDESAKTITTDATTVNVVIGDVIAANGFKIKTYRKNEKGQDQALSLGAFDNIWLSMEPENTEFYVENAFVEHPWFTLNDKDSATSTNQLSSWPATIAAAAFLTSGADGTAPATASDYTQYFTDFDDKSIRFLAVPDSTLTGVNTGGESYCKARSDSPQFIYNVDKQTTKALYITQGLTYQRSDQVQGVISAGKRKVSDPIGVGANPTIEISLAGAVIGNWVNTIYKRGIHRVPAGDDQPLLGFITNPADDDYVEDTFSDDDRTDLQKVGINIAQFVPGRGLLMRSFRCPSTDLGAYWGHYLLMQSFIKVSSVESLFRSENRPNRITAIQGYGKAVRDFGQKLHKGSFPFGIDQEGAFDKYVLADGTLSDFDDVFSVQANEFNNVRSDLVIGYGNIFTYFVPPPVTESLGIGVGVEIPLGA